MYIYIPVLLPNVVQQERVVSGEISVTGATYFVTPARCAVAQVPLLLRFRRYLFHRYSRYRFYRYRARDFALVCFWLSLPASYPSLFSFASSDTSPIGQEVLG